MWEKCYTSLYSSQRDGGQGTHQLVRLVPKIAIYHNLRLQVSEYTSGKTIADSAKLADPNRQLVSTELPSVYLWMLLSMIQTPGWCTRTDGQHSRCMVHAQEHCGDVIRNSWLARLGGITEACFLRCMPMYIPLVKPWCEEAVVILCVQGVE